jgi:transketolase
MEGVAAEAASLAGHLKLGKLIYLYDDNRITLAASTQLTFTEDRAQRFAAYGWHTQSVEDGNDLEAIDRTIRAARQETERPSLILVRTHIGYGLPHKHDTLAAHGSPLGEEEVKLTKQNLGWPVEPPFLVPKEAEQHFRKAIDRGREAEAEWNVKFAAYEKQFPEHARELRQLINGELPQDWDAGVSQGWHRYVGDRGDVIGVDRFGASAPGPVVMREFGFSVENVCKRALALLEREHV